MSRSHHIDSGDIFYLGDVFDIPGLAEAIELPILEWNAVKRRESAPNDLLGCWSPWFVVIGLWHLTAYLSNIALGYFVNLGGWQVRTILLDTLTLLNICISIFRIRKLRNGYYFVKELGAFDWENLLVRLRKKKNKLYFGRH